MRHESIDFPRITPSVARKLGHYVYLWVDPRTDSVFYVGKGSKARALAHLNADEKKAISRTVRAIRKAGQKPRIDILAHGLNSADTALKVEAAVIDLLGLARLANAVRGHGAAYGRMSLEQTVAHYTRRKVSIEEPALLIRINKLFHYGMSEVELYDATRSAWRLGPRKSLAKYAFAVFEGVIREVYQITGWHPAGSTFNSRTRGNARHRQGRFEFVGVLADSRLRKKYRNRYVGDLFPQGAQFPVIYLNVPEGRPLRTRRVGRTKVRRKKGIKTPRT